MVSSEAADVSNTNNNNNNTFNNFGNSQAHGYFAFFDNYNKHVSPKLRMFFSSNRQFPADLEECLQKFRCEFKWKDEQIVAHFFETVPYDPWQEKFGHPTLALIHFFKRKDIIFPVSVFSTTIESDHFMKMLYTVLLCPVERCLSVNLYNFPQLYKLWRCPFSLITPDSYHYCESLTRTLISSMSVIQMAIVIARYNNASAIENHAFAHLDAYMPLINGMSSCRNADVKNALIKFPVCLEWSLTHECIPDISSLITMSVSASKMHGLTDYRKMITSKFRVLNSNEVKIIYFLLKIIYKGMFIRCHNRDFWNFMRQTVGFDPAKRSRSKSAPKKSTTNRHMNEGVASNNICMMLFFIMVIAASLLGLYPISKGKMASIESRAKVYRMLIDLRNIQVRESGSLHRVLTSIFDCMFQNDSKLVLLSIFREYVTHLIEKTPGVAESFKKAFDWPGNMKYVITMSQIVRTDAERYIASSTGPRFSISSLSWFGRIFSGIDHKPSHLYEESRRCQKEATMNYNINAIVKLCEDMNLKKYSTSTTDQGSKLGREYMLENPHPQLHKKIEETMQAVIATFSKNMWIPMDWLVYFGVPVSDIQFFRFAVFRKSTQFERYIEDMYTNRPNIYKVMYNFFKLSLKYKEYKEYPAPARMYLAHCVALNKYHGVYGHIPPVLGKMQICPKCGDIKKPSFFRALKKNKNGGGLSIVRVCLDGRMVCGRKPKLSSWLMVRNHSITKNKSSKKGVRIKAHPDEFESDEDESDDEEEDEDDDDDDEDYYLGVDLGLVPEEDDEDYQIGFDYDAEDEEEEQEDEEEEEEDEEAELIFEKKKRVPASNHSSYTIKRKNAKHVATQHVLNGCRDTQTITIDTLGKIAVWKQEEWISCMQCIRSIPLNAAVDVNGEKICSDCFLCNRSDGPRFLSMGLLAQNNSNPNPSEFRGQSGQKASVHVESYRCEAGVCTSRMKTTEECKYLLVYDDMVPAPGIKQFRNMVLCAYHANFPWLKEINTVLLMSTATQAFHEKWGTKNGPRNTFIAGPEFHEL